MAVDPPHDPVTGNHWLLLASPQAGSDLRNEHLNAMLCPQGLETGLVEMIRGWLAAADNWGRFTNLAIGSEPGDDGMFEEWKAMGESIRALLRKYGELAELAEVMGEPRFRLNLPTLDRMVVAAMEWQELESGATPS